MQQLRRIALEAHLEKRLVGPAFKEGLFQLPGRGDVAEWRAVHHQQSRQSTLAALRQGHDLSWWRLLPKALKQGDKVGRPAACRYPATGLFDSRIHHLRSEEHTSELQSLMRNSYAVLCLKKTNTTYQHRPCHQLAPHTNAHSS